MLHRLSIGTLALVAALGFRVATAQAFDDALYPDLTGGWARLASSGNYDPSKPKGLGQQAPLTPKYQKVLEASLADQDQGGQGNDPGYRCHLHGMPRIMIAVLPIQFVVTPETTYVMTELLSQVRRIYTDGRAWPARLRRASLGYSIGRWVDDDGDGHYGTLLVETRGLKNPRSYDSSGIPFHEDEETIITERIRLDRANPDVLHIETTTIDNALTRPWTVSRSYRRNRGLIWGEYNCSENNQHVVIGTDDYFLSADGLLMPVRKGQRPPDLRYFDQAQR
jgi:hypothetical protein